MYVSMSAITMVKQNSPVCDISVLSREEREEHTRNTEKIFMSIQEIREIKDGYSLGLPAETEIIAQTGTFIAYERLCCPSFHFNMHILHNIHIK